MYKKLHKILLLHANIGKVCKDFSDYALKNKGTEVI